MKEMLAGGRNGRGHEDLLLSLAPNSPSLSVSLNNFDKLLRIIERTKLGDSK
jgi:hypothetical protein